MIAGALDRAEVPEKERASRIAETLGRAGFTDLDTPTAALSGGWRKRLAIVEGLVQAPDVLLLDEPTNHLDLAGIKWLETLLQNAPFACVVVSHDRYFLENVATEVVELARSYENGFLRVSGNYSTFLEAKEEYLHAQRKRQEALENLRAHGNRMAAPRPQSQNHKIESAHRHRPRNDRRTGGPERQNPHRHRQNRFFRDGPANQAPDRAGRRHLRHRRPHTYSTEFISPLRQECAWDSWARTAAAKPLCFACCAATSQPTRGEIRRADSLRIVYFDQNRELDPDISLRRALAPDSDSVIYQDRVIHVAAWAARFLFDPEHLSQPVGKLSGGERARVLIAQLMLQPADVLLLDEPTNDLDIPTLEILEESLLEYRGALVLVTHDRYMLDRVSTIVLGLDGLGGAERFADYSQWDVWQRARQKGTTNLSSGTKRSPAAGEAQPAIAKKKLSYHEVRELETIEERIAEADKNLEARRAALEDPAVTGDPARLKTACIEMEEAQNTLDRLYARWAELEKKKRGLRTVAGNRFWFMQGLSAAADGHLDPRRCPPKAGATRFFASEQYRSIQRILMSRSSHAEARKKYLGHRRGRNAHKSARHRAKGAGQD